MEATEDSNVLNRLTTLSLSAKDNMDTLKSKLEALPSELYNKIVDLTFSSPSGVYKIESAHKPPSCLQVNQNMRSKLIKGYYHDSKFCIPGNLIRKWIASLDIPHVGRLHEIRSPHLRSCRSCYIFARPGPGGGGDLRIVILTIDGNPKVEPDSTSDIIKVELGIDKKTIPSELRSLLHYLALQVPDAERARWVYSDGGG